MHPAIQDTLPRTSRGSHLQSSNSVRAVPYLLLEAFGIVRSLFPTPPCIILDSVHRCKQWQHAPFLPWRSALALG
jgi:hypothetical protein